MSEFRTESRPAPKPAPAPRPSRRSALLLWVIAGAGLLLSNLLSVPLARATAGLDFQLQWLLLDLLYYLPFAVLPVFLLARRTSGLWQAYRPYPVSAFSTLSIIALALLGVLFTTDLTALWSVLLEALGLHASSEALAIPDGARGLALSVLCVAVLPAVCEEFVFRGAILPALERNGTRRAALCAAAMFALLHGSLLGLPSQFLLGLVLCWLVIYCDSVYAGLIYHTVHNAATVILEYVLSRDAGAAAQPEYARMIDAVGGARGLFQLLLELVMMGAMMLMSLRMFRLSARLRGVEMMPPRRERLRGSEIALLMIGLALSALFLGVDIYAMLTPGGAA